MPSVWRAQPTLIAATIEIADVTNCDCNFAILTLGHAHLPQLTPFRLVYQSQEGVEQDL